MTSKLAILVLGASLSSAFGTAAWAGESADTQAVKALQAQSKTAANAKLGPVLTAVIKAHSANTARSAGLAARVGRLEKLLNVTNGEISVDIALKGDAESARSTFGSYGLKDTVTYKNHISGRLPIAALTTVSQSSSVVSVRPALSTTRVGLTTTQGDKAQRSGIARTNFDVNGAGYTVGVMSNSYACLTQPFNPDPLANFTTAPEDKMNDDLRKQVHVLRDLPRDQCADRGTDEGRAIMQLVHDVAPGSRLAFRTASVNQTDFARGIGQLVDDGAKVIVDDVIYYAEPMFQDGIIAQAVDAAKARGVAFFSSAGNDERQSYESKFRLSPDIGLSGYRHNFKSSGGRDTLQRISLDPGTLTLINFQWDQPFASVSGGKGSLSDLDLIFYKFNGDPVTPCDDNLEPAVCQIPGVDGNEGGDPIEIAFILNSGTRPAAVQLSIELYSGPVPGLVKYVWFDLAAGYFLVDEYDTQSSTSYGHTNAAGAEGVGAAAWYNTAAWGSPLWGAPCNPACLEVFSSAGGVPILFDTLGNRLSKPVVRLKPGITGPDGGNTSFFYDRITDGNVGGGEPDEFPNFFGTSASAPHVAGIAALMLQQLDRNGRHDPTTIIAPTAVPDFLFGVLRRTASDMRNRAGRVTPPFSFGHPAGFDFDSGYGFVDAQKALQAVRDSGVAQH